MIRLHDLHQATHYDSTASKRQEFEALAGRQVKVYARQHPRYVKYRNNPEAA